MLFRYSLITLLLLLLTPMGAIADSAPERTVREIISKMQEAKSPLPVLDYVHWEEAYRRMPEPHRARIEVTNPIELEAFYKQALKDPSELVKKQLKEKMESLSPEQAKMAEANMGPMLEMINEKIAQRGREIAETNFTVADSVISGNEAVVKLLAARDGKVKNEEINLVNIDGRWLLPWVQLAEPQEKKDVTPANAFPMMK